MAKIELKIYKENDKKEVEKTYTADGYELMLGTVEDFMAIIDVEKFGDRKEIAKMLVKGYKQLMPLLKDIFPDVTDEELRRVKVPELVDTFMQVGAAIIEGFDVLKKGN